MSWFFMFNSRQVLAIENHLEHRYFLCGCYFPLQQQFLHRLISEERQVTIGIKHRMDIIIKLTVRQGREKKINLRV
jgi:hypothetical protein